MTQVRVTVGIQKGCKIILQMPKMLSLPLCSVFIGLGEGKTLQWGRDPGEDSQLQRSQAKGDIRARALVKGSVHVECVSGTGVCVCFH